MWIDNEVYKEDMKNLSECNCIDWHKLKDKTIFITGGTGLIGSTLIDSLIYANEKQRLNLKIVALVRDLKKARTKFQSQLHFSNSLTFVEGAVEFLPKIEMPIDYIIHGASPTASSFFVEHPVETIKMIVQGTIGLLDLAVIKNVEGFVYLSSMEVYGAPDTDDTISETKGTTVDTMSVRSCYPEAKRICESLCASYASEYGVPSMVIRLAQTLGPGVDISKDSRVFAEFMQCALNGKDIFLQTDGKSRRCYLYSFEAVTAILTVLLNGKPGEAYNAANKETYCSIMEMAQLVVDCVATTRIDIHVPIDGTHNKKFPPSHKLNINTQKLENLGWNSHISLRDMYKRMSKNLNLS